MAKAKEIRQKIASIKKTQKITKAMQMVAASKMRRAEMRMKASTPYADKICDVVANVATSNCEHRHHYLDPQPETKQVGFIIVSTDRGLCGALNFNLFKQVLNKFRAWRKDGVTVKAVLIGQKAAAFFKNLDIEIITTTTHLGDKPGVADIIGSVKPLLDAYDAKEIDHLFIAHNYFINTMKQEPKITQLLPLSITNARTGDKEETKPALTTPKNAWDYIYEPNDIRVLEILFHRYIETEIYQGLVDNIACEQAARMVAMQSASENAVELINQFQLDYNKARQSAITQELSEIVGGADAV